MSHDFEPTEAEKEMLSHIKDIEVNRKQSELGNIISGAILDGQNQIHDLYKEKATAQEVEYRMCRSYTYWMNKLHQELQKARKEMLAEFNQRFEKLEDLDDIALTWLNYHVQKAVKEDRAKILSAYRQTTGIIEDVFTKSLKNFD